MLAETKDASDMCVMAGVATLCYSDERSGNIHIVKVPSAVTTNIMFAALQFHQHSSFRGNMVNPGAPKYRMEDVIEGIPTFPSQRRRASKQLNRPASRPNSQYCSGSSSSRAQRYLESGPSTDATFVTDRNQYKEMDAFGTWWYLPTHWYDQQFG
jgi:hypothetical protein